jgi:hypothetical protein
MNISTRAEIKRVFGNRFYEANPFKRNSAGMEWFARIIPLVKELSKREVETFLVPLINKLLKHTKECDLCTAKLLVFAEIYCSCGAPIKAAIYRRKYQECLKKLRLGRYKTRDFRSEVSQVIDLYL